jgi:hypothetical protein
VNRKMAFLLCTPHVQWFHMNKNLTDWTLSSCALPLPSAKAHQPHAHATDRARAWDTTAAGITFALQLTSRNEPLLYSFPIARRQSPPPGIQTAFHHTGVGGRGRSPFIIVICTNQGHVIPLPAQITRGYFKSKSQTGSSSERQVRKIGWNNQSMKVKVKITTRYDRRFIPCGKIGKALSLL